LSRRVRTDRVMPALIRELSANERHELLEDLNYLNMGEIKTFCKRHDIPYAIYIDSGDGRRTKTSNDDRKGVILKRVRHFLETGRILDATCFPANVVRFDGPRATRPSDRLFYGQYDKSSSGMLDLLQSLTAGRFRNGAVARILAREFWAKGVAPTYAQFAAAWLQATDNHTRPNPEWAFLSDRADGKDTTDWKRLRVSKAKRVLRILDRI
jgi:hypothetical protein